MKNTGFYGWIIVGVVFLATTVLVFGTENTSWPAQVLAACLGALVTIIATRLLLASQSKVEDKAKRDLEIYNAKLEVYSDFVSSMYEALKDNQITAEEFINLRTKLLGKVCFYVNDNNVLESITKELDGVKNYTDNDAMARVFAGITNILQKDLRKNDCLDTKEDVLKLSGKFDEISGNTNDDYELSSSSSNSTVSDAVQEENTSDIPQRLEQQAWHFNAWGAQQFEQLKEWDEAKEYELSLVEYGEDWRTNLIKQVSEGDIIMLFRRGGYGYVGAFKAIGRRIFYFEDGDGNGREDVLYFDKKEPEIVIEKEEGEKFSEHVKKYDIYNSRNDGSTLCSNLIVKLLAYVPGGVGNPGGVYRRTISRYDSHYAWLLKKRFQEKGLWLEQ